MGYFRVALKGIGWVGAFRGTSRVIAFAKLAILARLLTPAQFGVYGIASLVLAFLEIFTDTGVNTVLIQEKKKIDTFIDTAWVISIVRGIGIALIIVIVAPLVAQFFDSDSAISILRLISLVPLIRGFINPSIVRLQKELDFKREFFYRITIFSFDAIVAVLITYLTRSEVGIIYGFIVGACLETIWSFYIVKHRPRFLYDMAKFKYIIGKGKWVTGSRIFQYLFGQGDDILVGRLLGEASLGMYQSAYKLSSLPVSEVADVVGKVTFPVYVKIAKNKHRLKEAFIKSFRTSLFFIVFMGIVIYLFAEPIVLLLLGNQWVDVIPVLRILVFFGVAKGIATSFHSLFLATENQHYITQMTFVSVFVLMISIFPLVISYGIAGAAYAAIVGAIASLPFALYFLNKVFHE